MAAAAINTTQAASAAQTTPVPTGDRTRGVVAQDMRVLSIDQRAWIFQIPVADRRCRPIGKGTNGPGRIISGILRKCRGTLHEQVRHVPTLEVFIECAVTG